MFPHPLVISLHLPPRPRPALPLQLRLPPSPLNPLRHQVPRLTCTHLPRRKFPSQSKYHSSPAPCLQPISRHSWTRLSIPLPFLLPVCKWRMSINDPCPNVLSFSPRISADIDSQLGIFDVLLRKSGGRTCLLPVDLLRLSRMPSPEVTRMDGEPQRLLLLLEGLGLVRHLLFILRTTLTTRLLWSVHQ
jgi:hypothetical protein